MEHYSGLDTEYEASDLVPFSNYTFTLTVCTEGSCGQGQPVTAFTESAAPEGVVPPTITAIDESSLLVSWDHPLEANGNYENLDQLTFREFLMILYLAGCFLLIYLLLLNSSM